MTESDPTAPDGDIGDEDDAAIDEALAALTAGASLTATAEDTDEIDEDPDEIGEDPVGEAALFDEPDVDGAGDGGVPDDDAADDLIGDMAGDLEFGVVVAPIEFTEPGEPEDEPVFAEPTAVAAPADEPAFAVPPAALAVAAPKVPDERIERLEELTRALAAAAVTRDSGRVRRKVSASASGAAVVGAVPVILQLVGALDLTPEVAAAVAAAAATVASFVTGWATPERKPVLEPDVVQDALRPR